MTNYPVSIYVHTLAYGWLPVATWLAYQAQTKG